MAIVVATRWRISLFRRYRTFVAFRSDFPLTHKFPEDHNNYNGLCRREISCTAVYQSRRQDMKKSGIFEKVDRITLDILKNWPFLHGYYIQMSNGFKKHVEDLKISWKVHSSRRLNPNYQTTYKEHKALFDNRSNLIKSSFLLPIFLLPMGMIIIIIPVMMFPQYLLPRYYWNENQHIRYFKVMNGRRSFQHSIVLHHLTYLKNNHSSQVFREILDPIVKSVNNSDVPKNKDLLRLRAYCRGSANPLNVNLLPPLLLSSLCQINFLWHYFPPSWLAYFLNKRAMLIMEFDERLRRENLVYNLTKNELHDATFLRGLDCVGLTKEANQYWLKNWIFVTKGCTASDAAFIIHTAILLSRNYSEAKFRRRIFDEHGQDL